MSDKNEGQESLVFYPKSEHVPAAEQGNWLLILGPLFSCLHSFQLTTVCLSQKKMILRPLYRAGSSMPWWVRSCLKAVFRSGKICGYRKQQEPRRPEKHAVFTGHRELLPVLTDILHWRLERNRHIRKDQILDGAFQMHFPDALEA